MSPTDCFRVALKALSKNRLQTALTMIGLTIGVATVLTMFALGSGAQSAIEDQVRAAGMTLITVTSGNYSRKVEDEPGAIEGDLADLQAPQVLANPFQNAVWAGNPRYVLAFNPADKPVEKSGNASASDRLGDPEAVLAAPATLALGDAEAIRKMERRCSDVSEGLHTSAHLVLGSKHLLTRLHGDDVSLQFIRRAWRFEHGRFYTRAEQDHRDQVMVLGSVAADQLFGAEDPVGKKVTIWNQPFRVVGVVSSGSWIVAASHGDDQFDAAYIPFTTMHRLLDVSTLSDITLTAATAGDVTRVTNAVGDLIRERHHIGPNQRDDFTVTSEARKALAAGGMRPEVAHAVIGNTSVLDKVTLGQLSKTLERASMTMTALLACIAAVSLLVGGIGIMNIMLLSVTERTKEIGIRRAVGARSKDVLVQFLMEATTLSVAGGLAGIIIGFVVSILISRWAAWSTSISGISIALSFGVAAAVGMFFGYYPAHQASRVAPMESLRYE